MGTQSTTLIRVVVVDDSALVRCAITQVLRIENFEVTEAACADEALRLLESGTHVDVVLTDVEMPGSVDGIGLAQIVDKRWPGVALLVTSGHIGVHRKMLPKKAMFLPKPMKRRELVALVKALVGLGEPLRRFGRPLAL